MLYSKLLQILIIFSMASIYWRYSESQSVLSDSLQSRGLSVGFSRPEYWSGEPFPSPGDLPNPGIEHRSPTLQVDSLPSEPPGSIMFHGSISYKRTKIKFWYNVTISLKCQYFFETLFEIT